MADLRALLADLAAGRTTRRAFLGRASALGVSAHLAGLLASDPALAAFAQADQAEPEPPAAVTDEERTGPAAERLQYSAFNVDQAPLNIQNGDMDLYIFGLKQAGARSLEEGAEGVRLISAPASTVDLILNPAPAPEGQLNPFSIPEVRQAMQFLVNRDFIANDIYQGRAVPMYSHVSPFDYDELTVFQQVRGLNIRYDPEYARQVIAQYMTEAGATLDGQFWTFNGQPILLKFVTRVEDERRDVGDLVRAALGEAGFNVQPIYQPFGPATLAVYTTDPVAFEWHLYTEGWSRGAPVRYDEGAINSYAAPWLGNMPGWLETGYWQYEQAELDRIGQQIYLGTFKSREERDQLYREMTQYALAESVRIWLVTVQQGFPVREELQDVTEDLVSGPRSSFTFREATVAGRDEIRVGNLWVWTERTVFNPVGGQSDAYSADIARNLNDPALYQHPFTGLPEPFRAAYEVETAGPDGTLEVPEDAVRWDPAADAWTPVGAGVTAVSKATWDYSRYFGANYHHGQPISPADLVYSAAQAFELAYDEAKVQIETALGITSRPFLETIKGLRLLEDDRWEVYADYWHFEPKYIASYASLGGFSAPWEMLAAMDDIVFATRQGAYTDTTAARFSVPWLSLVVESDARLVGRTLQKFLDGGTVPAGVFEIGGRTLVTEEDAGARYQACLDWFAQTNLLVIGNGPYALTRYDPPAQFAELTAFRDPTYPFKPGEWRFGAAERLAITAEPPASAQPGEPIEVRVAVSGPGRIGLSYLLVDPTQGTVVAAADLPPAEGGEFTVSLGTDVTGALFPSVYPLYVLASSDAISQVAEQRVDLNVGL